MALDNYYEILHISPNAQEADVKGAIRALRKKYRRVTGSPNKEQARNAEVMMDKLAEAEKILLDDDARAKYDNDLRNRPVEREASPTASQSDDWIDTAKSYLANGQPRNAAQAAKEATRVEANNVQAWVVRAYADLELRDYADADFSASEAHRRDPQNPEILGLQGDVYDGEERYAEAQQAFQQAANLDPNNPYWQGRVIWAISAAGNGKEAVAAANTLVMKFPNNDYARNTYALMVLNDAENALSREGENIYVTNPAQIEYMGKQLEIVRGLNSSNETVTEFYNNLLELKENSEKRRYVGQGIKFWARILLVFFVGLPIVATIFSGGLGVILALLIFAGTVWFAFERAYPKQWKINKEGLGPIAIRTGLQK